MVPTFFALCSKAGIACAADSDHTIYRLSDNLPVAIAVNPQSPVPWEQIIGEYKQTKPEERELFLDYAADFGKFLSALEVKASWQKLTTETGNIIIFGYGSEDVFPSVFDVMVQVDENDSLVFYNSEVHSVTYDDFAFFHMLGNFDSVSTLLYGVAPKTREFFLQKQLEQFDRYSSRVMEKFKGTEYEEYVTKSISEFDVEGNICEKINQATDQTFNELASGVDSFSIEEMVTAVESIINANAKLNNLHSKAKGRHVEVKEIAVMTLPEGLTWIKHSIYMRRTEI